MSIHVSKKCQQLTSPSIAISLSTFLLGFLLLMGSHLDAQKNDSEPNTLTKKEKEEGWQLLFDGDTLSGWKSWNTKKPLEPGNWKAKNGALTLVESGGGDIYTAESFENFVFKIQFRTTGNSGIFFRVNPEYDGSIWKPAPEIQVHNNGPENTGSHSAGALYDLFPFPTDRKKIYPDGWNQLVIRIVDDQYTHWFNGQKVTEVLIGGEKWNKRVKKSKFNVDLFAKTRNGHFGLQDHGHKVQFRNIKVKPLPKTDK